MTTIPTTKMIDIDVNGFHFMRGVSHRCLFYPAPFLRRHFWLKRYIWVRVDFGFLSCILSFLRSRIGLLRCLVCFLCIFSKTSLNEFFNKKKHLRPYFSGNFSHWTLYKANDTPSVILLKNNGANNKSLTGWARRSKRAD